MKRSTQCIKKIVALLLLISILLGTLTGCIVSREPATKEEIAASVSATVENDSYGYDYVLYYLRQWRLPDFDTTKLFWAENVFKNYYVYNGGLPETLEHAAMTAEYFVENYYDNIDMTSKTAVTDAVIDSYVRTVGDPFSYYRTPQEASDFNSDMSGKFGGIGVMIEYDHNKESITISSIILDSPAEAAGFKVGDVIVGVDGRRVEDIGYLNAVNHVRGEIGTTVDVTVLRDGKELTLTATRAEVVERVVDYEITEDGYGYILITDFKTITYEQFVEAYDALEEAGVKGIIFDLRGNPGGYVASVRDVLSYLLPTGNLIMSCHYKSGEPTLLNSLDDVHPKTGKTSDHVLNVPAIVLCNQYTASSAEIFTSALRDYSDTGLVNVTVVGEKTYGKGIMQSALYYSATDTSTLTFTSAYYNPPSGVNYHGIGITPDLTVANSETEDLQLEAAINELKALINENN